MMYIPPPIYRSSSPSLRSIFRLAFLFCRPLVILSGAVLAFSLLGPAALAQKIFSCSGWTTSTGACQVFFLGQSATSGSFFETSPNVRSLSGTSINLVPAGSTHLGYSVIYQSAVNVQAFTTTFTFVPNGYNFALVVENANNNGSPRGFAAGAGGEGGFSQFAGGSNIAPNHVFALEFDSGGNNCQTCGYTNGGVQWYQTLQNPALPANTNPGYLPIYPTNKVSVSSPFSFTTGRQYVPTGHTYGATVTYRGSELTLQMWDVTAGGSCPGSSCFTHSWQGVYIPAIVGATTAYVGFTSGVGLTTASPLYVKSFSYTVLAPTAGTQLTAWNASATTNTGTASAASPKYSLAPGRYSGAQEVSLSTSTSHGYICYLLATSMPALTPQPDNKGGCVVGTRYSGPVKVSSSQTLYSMAGTPYLGPPSSLAAAAYTMGGASSASPPASAPTFSPAAGTYSSAQSVTISDATSDASIYYTTNGTTPTTSSARYTGPITVSSTETLKAISVAAGDANSAVASAEYTITSIPVASTEAYVYDTVAAGTYVYDASSSGRLTLVNGSPFETEGQIVGSNGKFFVTQGSGYLFSYPVESNGGIGKLISKINTQHYSGSECGDSPQEAEFDRTGAYVYTLLGGKYSANKKTCAAFQTFEISKSGELTFKGSTNAGDEATVLPAVIGNRKFAFSISSRGGDCCHFTSFSRESTGVLNVMNAHDANPDAKPGNAAYSPISNPAPDTTDHFALTMEPQGGGPQQLASYTVDSQGNTTSTNTWENMPTVSGDIYAMALNPTGKILAIAIGSGVQFFHFNGAAPISKFTGILETSGHFSEIAWDNDGHLYAQNASGGNLHVYAVTTTSAKELSGSPTVIPQGAFVVRTK